MHIAQGVLKSINVNRLTRAGVQFFFWVADLFAMMNGKYDGDLKKIRICGQYFVEVWRAAGMEMDNVFFLWASDEINAKSNEYIVRMIDIARRFNVPRIVRCCTIMGRKEEDDLSAAQIFYPCMQANDIFFLKVSLRDQKAHFHSSTDPTNR
jgi:tyrosyl-tRNA synthetase